MCIKILIFMSCISLSKSKTVARLLTIVSEINHVRNN